MSLSNGQRQWLTASLIGILGWLGVNVYVTALESRDRITRIEAQFTFIQQELKDIKEQIRRFRP